MKFELISCYNANFDFVGLDWDLRFCVSNKVLVAFAVADPWAKLREHPLHLGVLEERTAWVSLQTN